MINIKKEKKIMAKKKAVGRSKKVKVKKTQKRKSIPKPSKEVLDTNLSENKPSGRETITACLKSTIVEDFDVAVSKLREIQARIGLSESNEDVECFNSASEFSNGQLWCDLIYLHELLCRTSKSTRRMREILEYQAPLGSQESAQVSSVEPNSKDKLYEDVKSDIICMASCCVNDISEYYTLLTGESFVETSSPEDTNNLYNVISFARTCLVQYIQRADDVLDIL
jgi:hypothetical protein